MNPDQTDKELTTQRDYIHTKEHTMYLSEYFFLPDSMYMYMYFGTCSHLTVLLAVTRDKMHLMSSLFVETTQVSYFRLSGWVEK